MKAMYKNPDKLFHGCTGAGLSSVVLGLAFAFMTPAGASAEEVHLADYDLIEELGASWEYRMLDTAGQVVGDISTEVTEEESDGYFTTVWESNFGDMVGTATYRQRYTTAGERVVKSVGFSTEFDGTVVDSSSIVYDDPTENFASLTLGEEAAVTTTFTETSEDFQGGSQTRTGSLETTMEYEASEEIELPAGTFDAIRVRVVDTIFYDDSPQDPVVDRKLHWYVKDLGRVKRVFVDAESDDPHQQDELVDYSVPGAPGDPGDSEESFSDWVTAYELPEGEDAPESNPSGDGIANAIKYALGLDPSQSSRDQLPVPELDAADGEDYLIMEIPLNDVATGAEPVVEVSNNMEDWESGEQAVTVIEKTDSLLRVRDNTPVSSGEERFARLRVDLLNAD